MSITKISAYASQIAPYALACAAGFGIRKCLDSFPIPDTVSAYSGPVAQVAGAITLGLQISKYQNGPMCYTALGVQLLALILTEKPDGEPQTLTINAINTFCAISGAVCLNHASPYKRALGWCFSAILGGEAGMLEIQHHYKATNREYACNTVAHTCLGLYACYIGHKALSSNAIGNLAAALSLLAGTAKLAALAIRKFRPEAPRRPSIAEFMERFTQINLVVAGGIAFSALLNRLRS